MPRFSVSAITRSAGIATLGSALALSAVVSLASAQGAPPRPARVRPADSAEARSRARAVQPGQRAAQPRRAGAPGAPGARNAASMMLRMRDRLELTDDQARRLEALAAAPSPRINEAEMLRARADLVEASRGEGNLSATRAALDKMSRLRNEQIVASLKARQDARAVLTDAQRRQIDQLRDNTRGRAGNAMRRGMRGGMRGGKRPGTPGMPGMRPGMAPGMRPGMAPGMGRGMRGAMPGAPGMPGVRSFRPAPGRQPMMPPMRQRGPGGPEVGPAEPGTDTRGR